MSRDAQIVVAGQSGVPLSYTVSNAVEIILRAVNATFDGTGAAGAFAPTLEIISDGGVVVARSPTATAVAAGGSAEVSWFPSRKPCPPSGPCPSWPGGNLCGNINLVGQFAEGSGGGLTTTLTINRKVDCPSLIVVVGASLAAPGTGGAIITGCTDTKGNRYDAGISSTEQSLAGPTDALEVSMAVTSVAANVLTVADTITVTWDPAVVVADSMCMAVALTNVSMAYTDSANGISFPGTGGTSNTDLLWGPSTGLPAFSVGGFVGASLCAIAATPPTGIAFDQATLIHVLSSGNVSLGLGLVQSLEDGELYEPGGTMGGASVSVANFTEIRA